MIQHKAVRYGLFALWVAIAAGALYLYFFKRDVVQSELRDALSASFWIASISYLLIGADDTCSVPESRGCSDSSIPTMRAISGVVKPENIARR